MQLCAGVHGTFRTRFNEMQNMVSCACTYVLGAHIISINNQPVPRFFTLFALQRCCLPAWCVCIIGGFIQTILDPSLFQRGINLINFAYLWWELGKVSTTKGQLISKCPFGVIVSTKIPTEKFDNFCPRNLKRGQIIR